jgi:hypothetical protein
MYFSISVKELYISSTNSLAGYSSNNSKAGQALAILILYLYLNIY